MPHIPDHANLLIRGITSLHHQRYRLMSLPCRPAAFPHQDVFDHQRLFVDLPTTKRISQAKVRKMAQNSLTYKEYKNLDA